MAFYADRGMLGTPAGAPPGAHAPTHQDGGSDEISTATPAADAIPKADGSGTLDGWVSDAASGTEGKVALDTDLGGTAAAPQVVGLQGDALPAMSGDGFVKRDTGDTAWEEVSYGAIANTICEGDDSRLSDARTPTAHASSHENGGSDEISVAGLSGVLADEQTQTRTGIALVTKGGNDGTAAVGNFGLPYLTIQAAVTACSAGQAVWVAPGNYAEEVTGKDGVNVYLFDGATITAAAGAGTATAFTMAESMVLGGGELILTSTSGGTATGLDFGSGTAHMTSRVVGTKITGTGAGDTIGADVSGVTGVADESHYCMQGVHAQLVSESAGRGVVGGGTAATNQFHMKECAFAVVGTGGVGCEVIGLISAPDCYFWGTSSGVLNVSPSTNNVLRYTPGTRWSTVSGAGGYTRLAGFEHNLEGNAVFVDAVIGDNDTAVVNDKSRPYATHAAAMAVASSGDTVYAAPGTYAESVVLPAGVNYYAPDATVNNIVVGSGGRVRVKKVTPGASVSAVLVSGGTAFFEANEISLSGNGSFGFLVTGSSSLLGRVDRIVEGGSYTTTTGISALSTGRVTLFIGVLNADTAYSVGGTSTLDLFAGSITGTETVTGTANVTRASRPPNHASRHDAGGADAMAIDAAAGTGSLRTLGTSSTAACAGDDSRLSDARTPTAHNTSHQNGGADQLSIAGLSGVAATYQKADNLKTTGSDVALTFSAPPVAGQALVAISPTAASWLNPFPTVTAQTTTPKALTAIQTNSIWTNEGASAEINFTLPNAGGGNVFTFIVANVNGIKVTAAAGDTIRILGNVSAAAGTIEAATVGDTLTIAAINATEWVATASHGTWTVT